MSLIFDPADPFPLVDLSSIPYDVQKAHAKSVDQWLGFEIETVESAIERAQLGREMIREQWVGLDPQSLQTPYVEFRAMLENLRELGTLKPGSTVVDLGAAYGRLGWVMASHAPDLSFVGIEISEPRVQEANRVFELHAVTRARMICADALEGNLPVAQVYFTYDFGSMKSIDELLEHFKEAARARPLTIVGRGRATRDKIEREHPWLSQIHPARHFGNFSLYQS